MPKYTLSLSNTLYQRNLNSYLSFAKDNIVSIKQKHEQFISRLSQGEEPEDWLEEASHHANIEWLFLNSIFVTMYSSFEHFLMKVARTLERQPGIKIKLSHISGRGILEQYTNYLYLVGGLESASKEKACWTRLPHYQQTRNLLAHNGGIISDDAKKDITENKLYKFLKQQDVVLLGNLGLIRIRGTKILESFIADTTFITNNLLLEFNEKFKPETESETNSLI